jgi:hypothetical protein
MSFRGVLGDLLIPRHTLGSLLLDGVPPRSEIQATSANSVAPAHARTVRLVKQKPWPLRQVVDRLALGRGSSVPPQRVPLPVLIAVIGAGSVPTHFLVTPLGTSHEDLLDRSSMAGSKDSFDVSPTNIIESTRETLPAEEQLEFEEHQEQLIMGRKAKFMTNFKVDRINKVVRQRATDLASL